MTGDSSINDDSPANRDKSIAKVDVATEEPVVVNGSDDEEFRKWKAGRHEWLIIIDLVAVVLIVVCRVRHLEREFHSDHLLGARCYHSSSSTLSKIYTPRSKNIKS
jgi:hypothetical protein